MDKILTVQQPFASCLVTGVKRYEYRSWRIPNGSKVWIHAGMTLGVKPDKMPEYLDSLGNDAITGAKYLRWSMSLCEERPTGVERDALAHHIWESLGEKVPVPFPCGVVIGWCIFGEAIATEGEERKLGQWANPVHSFYALPSSAWKMHKGALGLRPFGGVE